jgi:hypothetical protein
MSCSFRAGGVQPGLPRLVSIRVRGMVVRTRPLQMLACLSALCLAGLAQAATPAAPAMTLEQAVAKVQDETGGKILSADPRQLGRRMEYRIKVLTPDGHVRIVVISSEAPRAGSGKNPAGNGAGNKEKH